MIEPTVGRIVWLNLYGPEQQQPLAAQIAHVNDDGTLNLGYLDQHGVHRNATHIPLIQPGQPTPDKNFCIWMPYQISRDSAKAAEVPPQPAA